MISDPAVCPLLVITPSMRVVGNVSSPGTEPVDTQSSASHSRVLGRGIVQFLATQGGTNPYMNPVLLLLLVSSRSPHAPHFYVSVASF
jgi:hypothetical protein